MVWWWGVGGWGGGQSEKLEIVGLRLNISELYIFGHRIKVF